MFNLGWRGLVAIFLISAPSDSARAEDLKVKIAYAPYLNFQLVNKESLLQFGPEFRFSRTKHTAILRLHAKFPFADKTVGENIVQLDRYSRDWRAGGSVDYQYDWTGDAGPAGFLRIGASAEWGVSHFEYQPGGGAKQSTDEHSFAVEGRVMAWLTRGGVGAWQFAPQFWLRYTREWKAAEKIGIVVPSTDPTTPSTVKEFIADKPDVAPGLSIRISMPTYLGGDRFPIAIGPSVAYALLGISRDFDPGTKTGRLRAELWVYYFPLVNKVANVRIGVAPFIDSRMQGIDTIDQNVYGALVQLRVGATMLEY